MFNIGSFSKKKEFDSNALTKHAVVLGATGSGKTVLCKSIIEEAVLNNIPIIAIDPKGDISSLGICSNNFKFRPFCDIEAKSVSKEPEKYEEELKKLYEKEIKNSNITKNTIKKYCDKINLEIYTPKSNSGKSLSVAPDLKVPHNFKQLYDDDPNITSNLIEPIAETLLSLVEYPLSAKKEITLVTKIIEEYWLQNKSLEIIQLIHSVSEPPFEKIGALSLDLFISKKQRQLLASKLNLLLTTPSLKYWFTGDAIDFDKLLENLDTKENNSKSNNGKQKSNKSQKKVNVNVIDLRFISEEKEKQFFVERFLQELFKWLLRQKGTQNLKYILYFDEIKSFIPSFPNNPPSKKMLELIVRQGRAFGLGCLFATQNPGDIDYKVLGNINTRFIGKLRTAKDIEKVSTGINISKKDLTQKIGELRQSEFIYNEQDSNSIDKIKARWLISYHRGPLSEEEISLISKITLGEKLSKQNKRIIEQKEEEMNSKSSEFAIPLSWSSQQLVDSIKRDSNIKIIIEDITTYYKPILHTNAIIKNQDMQEYSISLDSNLNKRIHSTFRSDIDDKKITTLTIQENEKQNVFLDRELAENQAILKIRKLISGTYYVSKECNFHSRNKKEILNKNKQIAKDKLLEELNKINSKFNPLLAKKKEYLKQVQKEYRELEYEKDVETEKIKDSGKSKNSKLKNKLKIIKEKLDEAKKDYDSIQKDKKQQIKKITQDNKKIINNIQEINFNSNSKDIDIKANLIWAPKQEIIAKIISKKHEFKTKIIHNWKGIISIGTCQESKKNLVNIDDVAICSYCAKTFHKKHIHYDSISSKQYCSEHFVKCELSGKKFGIDVLKKCPNCERMVSPEFMTQCPECGNVVCEKCIIKKGIFKKTPVECKLCHHQK